MKINLERIQKAKEFDKNIIGLIFNYDMSNKQVESGILGKATIHHPAFTTRVTIYEGKDGVMRVQPSSVKTGDNRWFNIVSLTENLRDFVLEEFVALADGKETEAWYLQEQVPPKVLDDTKNESLDIEDIVYSTKLSDKQKEAGIVAKATIRTSVGSLRGYTIFNSKYGKGLYGVAQAEDEDGNIPAYRLSKQAEAQVLLFLHNSINEWEAVAPKKEKKLTAEEQRANIQKAVNSQAVPKTKQVFK